MVKCKAFHRVLPDEKPFVSNTGPLIKNLVSLNQCRTVRQPLGRRGLKNSGEDFLTHDVNQTNAVVSKRPEHVFQNGEIVCLVVKIPERGKHIEHESKRTRTHEFAHVLLDPVNVDLSSVGSFLCLVQEKLRSIDACHGKFSFCQCDGASAGAARQVKRGCSSWLGEGQYLVDLLLRFRESLVRKHKGVEFLPERVVVEPFFFIRSLHLLPLSKDSRIRRAECVERSQMTGDSIIHGECRTNRVSLLSKAKIDLNASCLCGIGLAEFDKDVPKPFEIL